MSRSKSKVLAPDRLSAESSRVMRALESEADLATAVVGASYLEASLGTLLAQALLRSSVTERALDPRGALGTFSARADLVYALALIPKPMYQDIGVIAEVRNRFAHSHAMLSFNDAEVAALCGRLGYLDYFANESRSAAIQALADSYVNGPRTKFILTIAVITGRLAARSAVLDKPPYEPGL